jgi:hypothetical protein
MLYAALKRRSSTVLQAVVVVVGRTVLQAVVWSRKGDSSVAGCKNRTTGCGGQLPQVRRECPSGRQERQKPRAVRTQYEEAQS